jgi:hypothetical protein
MPAFDETVEIRQGWGDWIVLRQNRDTAGGRFLVHNPWGNSDQPQGAGDRNRLELGYRAADGSTRWGQVVVHGPTGNVGLGLVAPRTPLHVLGRIATGLDFNSAGAVTFFPPDGFAWFHIDNGPAGGRPIGRLRISHGNTPGATELVSVLQNGRVGVGTATPRERFDVNGNIAVTGDIKLFGADCAEEFAAAEPDVEPGTVMVLGDEGSVRPSEQPYDKKVAGVVSGAGEYRPGLVLDTGDGEGDEERARIALVGKVFCKVDAEPDAVEVGDLLTSAERPGHAMKAADPARAFGAVLGKALRPLRSGQDLVPILVALQ